MTTKRRVGRPRDGNPEETRREILRAAEAGFATSGYAGATTRQVAGRAGVNVATLHYHFGSKEGLYRAVLDAAAAGQVPAPPDSGPSAERLATFVESLFEFGAARPALARLALLDRLAGPAAAPETRVTEDPRLDPLRRFLAAIPASGANGRTTARPSPEAAARGILTLLDASLLGRETSPASADAPPDTVPPEVAKRSLVAAALKIAGL